MAAAHLRAARLAPHRAQLEAEARRASPPPGLATALRRGPAVAVIAEVKRRSPSRGDIRPGLDAAEQAAAYETGGAAAISVLTEAERFGGRPEDLVAVRARVALPTLRKDFLVDPIQLVESRALGASAGLIIVRAVDPGALDELIDAGRSLGLELLVEAHTRVELERALASGATIVGINNRDLESLEVDPVLALSLTPELPGDVVAVIESGISSRGDVERAAEAGADAVLVGTAVSGAADPELAVRGLCGVARRSTARG